MFKKILLILSAYLIMSLQFQVHAQIHVMKCKNFFVAGVAPSGIDKKSQEYCYNQFVLSYLKSYYTAIWGAEHLTKDQIILANHMKQDADIKENSYQVGYVLRSIIPYQDMSTIEARKQSFVEQNNILFDQNFNVNQWHWIEEQIHRLAIKNHNIYVVTGGVFSKESQKVKDNRKAIPIAIWKAVYIPELQQSGVYYCLNKKGNDLCSVISQAHFIRETAIDPFPALPDHIKKLNKLRTTDLSVFRPLKAKNIISIVIMNGD